MDQLNYAKLMAATLRNAPQRQMGHDPMGDSVMSRPAEAPPEINQDLPLEPVNPEDWVPNPKSLVAALKAGAPLLAAGTQATRLFGREIVPEVLKAEKQLSPKAKQFSSDWNMNWNRGQGQFLQSPEAAELQAAFAPVRDKMRRVYGDTIPLYRGERGESDPSKLLFSWTPERKIAEQFAANSSKFPKQITDAEIEEVLRNFNTRGFAQFRGEKYLRNKDDPRYFDTYNRRNELITGGDNLEKSLLSDQVERQRYLDSLRNRGKVYEKEVPIDQTFWIPTGYNLKEPEVITLVNPRK